MTKIEEIIEQLKDVLTEVAGLFFCPSLTENIQWDSAHADLSDICGLVYGGSKEIWEICIRQ